MKVVSFNTNSLRIRLHQIEAIIKKHSPEFIGIQETKVNDPDFPIKDIEAMGYHVEFHGQKTHYGVALMSKRPFLSVQKGFLSDDETAQKRFIEGRFALENGKKITVINGYFPQGESRDHPTKFPNKRDYYRDLQQHLNDSCANDEFVIVMGDVNVSHTDDDIGIGDDNRKRWIRDGKCSFLPEEREWLDTLIGWGLSDTYRLVNTDLTEQQYSWFDYRSRGFEREPRRGLRIDLILANAPLAQATTAAGIDYDIRGLEKPSDHCPIWTEFKLT